MNMDERKLTYDQFKADILHWKNTHREEFRASDDKRGREAVP